MMKRGSTRSEMQFFSDSYFCRTGNIFKNPALLRTLWLKKKAVVNLLLLHCLLFLPFFLFFLSFFYTVARLYMYTSLFTCGKRDKCLNFFPCVLLFIKTTLRLFMFCSCRYKLSHTAKVFVYLIKGCRYFKRLKVRRKEISPCNKF